MTSFVLVHGGGHGSWCWDRVVGPLRDAGHRVEAVDLPGRDGTLPDGYDAYVDVVAAAVDPRQLRWRSSATASGPSR